MGVYKRIGSQIHYFKSAAEKAAFLNGGELTEKVKQESKKKSKKK